MADAASERGSTLWAKWIRHRDKPLPELAAKAVSYTRESARALIALRQCDTGSRIRVNGRLVVKNEGLIRVGSEVRFNAPWNPIEMIAGPGAEITIGDECDVNYGTLISAAKSVRIGRRVMIGNHSIVADTEVPGSTPASEAEPIEIGDGAWLAVRVTVLPGAKIGAGAVITAGSVVRGEIPPGVVAGGIPARVLRATGGADRGATANAASTENGAKRTSPTNGVAHAERQADHKAPPQAVPAQAAAAIARKKTSRGVLVADFTIDELATQLAAVPGPLGIEATVAPFGQVVQVLMQEPDPEAADFAVVWTRPETAITSFARIVGFEAVDPATLDAEVDQFCDLVARAAARYRFVFVPTWTMPHYERGLGLLDARQAGASRALARMNFRLMDKLGSTPNAYVLDAQRWLLAAGKSPTSPKLWYLGKVPFSAQVFAEAATDVHAAIGALGGDARKLVVVDLDDTMWGGIVGDVGWENLRLGGHDGLGEAFVDFQRGLKALTRRGVVLAIVSKNEEATALEAIRKHPEMLLREEDFVAHRINWRDKAQNILEIANELNLGLQSTVFLDDNPVERARVREALPEVLVPEWPEDKHMYRAALASLRCFDTPSISKEDQERTALYAAERQRERLQSTVGSMEDWLKSLGIHVTCEPLRASNIARSTQLLNKTNQLNLSTRRLTESELLEWTASPGRATWAVSVRDRFGDAGLTGLVSVEVEGDVARIVDYVLSCRVMGRKVEDTMVHLAVTHAREKGARRVEALFKPSTKNKPCLTFWQASGFACDAEMRFTWDASVPYALPEAIALEVVP